MNVEDLTPEQMEKIRSCKTPEELLAVAEEVGYELSSEELEAVTGGADWWDECSCDGSGYERGVDCSHYTPFLP